MSKYSTTDLHNIKQTIYLGYLAQQAFKPSSNSYEVSFFGGEPVWLHPNNNNNEQQLNKQTKTQTTTHGQNQSKGKNIKKQSVLKCSNCNITLCFMGQMYCPFDAEHCYHRVLYFLFCDKCNREFRCIRQQALQNYKPSTNPQLCSSLAVRKISEQAKQLYTDPYSKSELVKKMNRFKIQLQQQQAIQQAHSQEEEQTEDIKAQYMTNGNGNVNLNEQFKKYQQQMKEKHQSDSQNDDNYEDVQQIQQVKKGKGKTKGKGKNKQKVKKMDMKQKIDDIPQPQKTDIQFQTYKRMISQLDNPCVIYTDTPIPYNSTVLNPQHVCKNCGSKLTLQIQITQQILNMNMNKGIQDNNNNMSLLMMDWGSIMVYTCAASCHKNNKQGQQLLYVEECVVVQYEIDAINDQDLNKLKKKKKNRKRKEKKSKSKSKEKANKEGDQQQKQKSSSDSQQHEHTTTNSEKHQQPATQDKNVATEVNNKQKKSNEDKGDWD